MSGVRKAILRAMQGSPRTLRNTPSGDGTIIAMGVGGATLGTATGKAIFGREDPAKRKRREERERAAEMEKAIEVHNRGRKVDRPKMYRPDRPSWKE